MALALDALTWLPAWKIREKIVSGEVSAMEVTKHFLGRIETLDPVLHAFRTVDYKRAREQAKNADAAVRAGEPLGPRSEEHTSELQSLMRSSYAVFCLKKKKKIHK